MGTGCERVMPGRSGEGGVAKKKIRRPNHEIQVPTVRNDFVVELCTSAVSFLEGKERGKERRGGEELTSSYSQ